MEPPTPAPEDEFEFYFQKAAKNKHLVHIQLTHDPEPRRGSLPSAVTSSADARGGEQLPVIITVDENSHHRAASCKATPTTKSPSKQIRHSPSARLASEKRPSHGDIRSTAAGAPGNGFLSPSSAGDDAAATSTSAPQSRSGSFRRASRDGGVGGGDGAASLLSSSAATGASRERRRSSVYLEETVAAKLRELKQMEDENCLVVRQFTMSPQGDIINRVDSFKKKRESSPKAASSSSSSSTTTKQQQQQQPVGGGGGRLLLQVPGQELRLPGRPAILPRLISCEPPRRVLVIGDRGVGKTALMQQFMTSEYLAALDTSFDTDATDEKSVSVCVDGEEMTLQFTDLEPEEQLEHRQLHPDVDCYLLVYSIADKKSFAYISSLLLHDLSSLRRTFAVIIVANKSDVVRKRQVNDTEAMDVCTRFSAKFIEVSAALNHKVDELLIGIVNQIRLNPNRRQRLESSAAGGGGGGSLPDEPPTPTAVACSKGTRSFLSKLFSKKKKTKESRPCENLQTL